MRLGEGLASFFFPNVLADKIKHTLFPYMPCPECAPAAFAHAPLLSPLMHSSYKESCHLNGFTLTCLGTHIRFFGTCSPIHTLPHTQMCVYIVSVPCTLS